MALTRADARREDRAVPVSTSLGLLAGALLVTATATAAVRTSSSETAAVSEGVTSLTYAPKPFYDDLPRMRIRFTTTGRARPGSEYVVVLFISGANTGSMFDCDDTVISTVPGSAIPQRRILGAPGRRYGVWLLADRAFGRHFCLGRARLSVSSTSLSRPSSNRDLRTIRFRVLHAS